MLVSYPDPDSHSYGWITSPLRGKRSGQRLGYASIRLNQLNAIKSFMEGNDIFVILPTGSGKSLCFTVLPFAFDCLYQRDSSIVIVVSPLIALMKDQVATLNSKGLSAAYLSSEMNDRAQQERILRGEVQVLYIGPELLMLNTLWRDMLTTPVYKENLVAFVVDEAHCVAKWGDYFRQEFKYLGAVRSLIPSHVHVMALTATATVATRDTVVKILGMNSPTIVSASPDKPNICYATVQMYARSFTGGHLLILKAMCRNADGQAETVSQHKLYFFGKRLTSEHIVPKTCNRTALETMCAEELD
eukprot:Em0006g780a